MLVVIVGPVLVPATAPADQVELLAGQGVERVGDTETFARLDCARRS